MASSFGQNLEKNTSSAGDAAHEICSNVTIVIQNRLQIFTNSTISSSYPQIRPRHTNFAIPFFGFNCNCSCYDIEMHVTHSTSLNLD